MSHVDILNVKGDSRLVTCWFKIVSNIMSIYAHRAINHEFVEKFRFFDELCSMMQYMIIDDIMPIRRSFLFRLCENGRRVFLCIVGKIRWTICIIWGRLLSFFPMKRKNWAEKIAQRKIICLRILLCGLNFFWSGFLEGIGNVYGENTLGFMNFFWDILIYSFLKFFFDRYFQNYFDRYF